MLCLFKCVDSLGCRNQVINKCAFHPPKPTYKFVPINEDQLQNDQFVERKKTYLSNNPYDSEIQIGRSNTNKGSSQLQQKQLQQPNNTEQPSSNNTYQTVQQQSIKLSENTNDQLTIQQQQNNSHQNCQNILLKTQDKEEHKFKLSQDIQDKKQLLNRQKQLQYTNEKMHSDDQNVRQSLMKFQEQEDNVKEELMKKFQDQDWQTQQKNQEEEEEEKQNKDIFILSSNSKGDSKSQNNTMEIKSQEKLLMSEKYKNSDFSSQDQVLQYIYDKDQLNDQYDIYIYNEYMEIYENLLSTSMLNEQMGIQAYKLRSESGNELACLHIRHNQKKQQGESHIIVYSHGNSSDMGIMVSQYLALADNLKIDIFAYDYSGYGESTGDPTDINILQDIKSIYKYVTKVFEYKWQKIIMYGQSIGSGPSIFIASRREFPIGGCIIHSGFSSGLRVTIPKMEKTHQKDLFPNVDLIQYVRCPVFIIHGTKDTIVPIEQAEDLYERVSYNYEPFFVKEAGHNNIEYSMKFKGNYLQKVKQFYKNIQEMQKKLNETKLLKKNTAKYWCTNFEHFYKSLHPVVYVNTILTQTTSRQSSVFRDPIMLKSDHNFGQSLRLANSSMVTNFKQNTFIQQQQQQQQQNSNRRISFNTSNPNLQRKGYLASYEAQNIGKHQPNEYKIVNTKKQQNNSIRNRNRNNTAKTDIDNFASKNDLSKNNNNNENEMKSSENNNKFTSLKDDYQNI